MKNIIFFCFLMSLGNCRPTEQPNVDTIDKPKLVWQTSIGGASGSMYPLMSGDFVIFSNESNRLDVLKILDKKTGKSQAEWRDFLDGSGIINDTEGRGLYENNGIVILPIGSRVHAIDIKNNKTLWKNKASDAAGESITGLGSVIFQSKYKSINGVNHGYVAKSSTTTGQWEEVFADSIAIDFRNTLQAPVPYIDKNGDTLLFVIQSKYRFPPQERNLNNLICYNLSKRQLKYNAEITPPADGSSYAIGIQPQIFNDKIVIRAKHKLICFDLNLGKQLWEVQTNEKPQDQWSSFLVADGKVFGYALSATLICYDLNNGNMIWKNSTGTSGSICSAIEYHNGYIYYSTGGLEAVNVLTGKRVWNYSSPSKEFFDIGLRIDKSSNKLYVSDYKGNAYCYQTL
jgi:outer membrane protein assembly factor BamB